MTARPRPLLAVRLIGPAAIVAEQKAYLTAYLGEVFREKASCRVSTHPASYTGESRVYLTLTRKENP